MSPQIIQPPANGPRNERGRASDAQRAALASQAAQARSRLESWIEKNGWAGFDPYDIIGTRWYRTLAQTKSLPARAVRKISFGLIRRYPLAARKVARLQAINPKAMGLLTTAYCRLFEASGDPRYLDLARECAGWLLKNPSDGYAGMSWGYPFDWESKVFIPRGTPSVVVSTAGGEGLWHLARLTGDTVYDDACVQICEFITRGLQRTTIDPNTVCFSYTPIDNFLVHNANLFAAEFLARVAQPAGKSEWTELAVSAGNYALSEQNADGSIFYWGRQQNEYAPNHLDCYHSGFEIRCLRSLATTTQDRRFEEAALKYFAFFTQAYLGANGEVMTAPQVVYPVDIHACAEALLCPATLYDVEPQTTLDILSRVLPWILKMMQNPDGSFAYLALSENKIDRTPYLRWGQAWMLRALAEVEFALRDLPATA